MERAGYDVLIGAVAVVVAFVYALAPELPGLVLTGLLVAILFFTAFAVSMLAARRLPRLAVILIPATVVVGWTHLVWSPWVLRVGRSETHLSSELSTLIALVFLYELASSRYRKRHERKESVV
ncbi:MAG: hypothetical protein R3A46_09795 [Thermomicrobiales bacterium]